MYSHNKQLILLDDSIQKAMKIIDDSDGKCLFVIDSEKRLIGSLSDGDIRRSILNGKSFKGLVSDIYNENPYFIFENEYTVDKATDLMKSRDLDSIPIVNKKKIIVNIVDFKNNHTQDIKNKGMLSNIPVVIMAGGLGTRLDPITKIIPKPLIPLKDSTIIEVIIKKFFDFGCSAFYATVNYKSNILKAYFEDIEQSYALKFIDEDKPLGTAGSLNKLKGKIKKPFFVTNCDIIINTDYKILYDFHIQNKFDLTLVAAAKTYTVPYGTCVLNENGNLSHINEKPTYEFLTNTGLYIVNPEVLESIPKNKFFHITHLIERIKNKGKNIGVFPVSGDSWVDTGQLEDYKEYISKFS